MEFVEGTKLKGEPNGSKGMRYDLLSAQIDQEIEAHQNIIKELQLLRKTVVDEDWNFNIMRSLTFKYDSVYLELAEKANATYTTMMQYFNNADPNYFHAEVSMVRRKKRLEGNGFPWKSYTERTVFDQGMAFHKSGFHKRAYIKFMQAWRIYNMSVNFKVPHDQQEIHILDYLQYSAGQIGRLNDALWLCERAARLESDQKERMEILANFWRSEILQNYRENFNWCDDENAKNMDITMSENASLNCRYNDRRRNPLFVLSPLKEEILNLDPLVVRFYDVISNNQMEMLKKMAKDDFDGQDQSTDGGANRPHLTYSYIEDYPEMLVKLNAMANLRFENSEFFVGYYRTGGSMDAHDDASDLESDGSDGEILGNRIATLLVYLNQPENGGGTVFNRAGVRISPTLGSALFWFNRLRNETIDERTYHAGCPVTAGEKFVIVLVSCFNFLILIFNFCFSGHTPVNNFISILAPLKRSFADQPTVYKIYICDNFLINKIKRGQICLYQVR